MEEQKHDLIFIERTCRWVCKCGACGYLKSDMLIHEQEIEAEAIQDQRIENLMNDVEEVECNQNRN